MYWLISNVMFLSLLFRNSFSLFDAKRRFLEIVSPLKYPFMSSARTTKELRQFLQEQLSANEVSEEILLEAANVFLFGKYGIEVDDKRAMSLYGRLAHEFKNARAFTMLGFMHEIGAGVPEPSPLVAFAHYLHAATIGDFWARCIIGYRFSNGIGVPSNPRLALNFYEKASQFVTEGMNSCTAGSDPIASLEDASGIKSENIFKKKNGVIDFCRYSADHGDQNAQMLLGRYYYHGADAVRQSFDLAFRYFSLAAKGGNGIAAGYLAVCYASGRGTGRNSVKALEYAKRGIAAQSGAGYFALGMLIEHREHPTEAGLDKAIVYYTIASDKDFAESHYRLATIILEYAPGLGIPKIMHYLALAARQNLLLAHHRLGTIQQTIKSELSLASAIRFFKATVEKSEFFSNELICAYHAYHSGAAEYSKRGFSFLALAGHAIAQMNYAHQLAAEGNFKRAIVFWNRAAHHGQPLGFVRVGDAFCNKKLLDLRNEALALRFYLAADAAGNTEGTFNVAYMHEIGAGTRRDPQIALEYYKRALAINKEECAFVFLAIGRLKVKLFFSAADAWVRRWRAWIISLLLVVAAFYFYGSLLADSLKNLLNNRQIVEAADSPESLPRPPSSIREEAVSVEEPIAALQASPDSL